MPVFLDRDAPDPLYKQIKREVVKRITDGTYVEKLPGEVDLAAEFQVARPSVRKALSELVDEDVITRSPARGTFIKAGFRPALRSVTCLLYQAGPGDLPAEPMNSPIEREIVAGAAAGARDAGARFDLMLVDFYQRDTVMELLHQLGGADGIIAVGYMPVVEVAVNLGLSASLCYSDAGTNLPVNNLSYDRVAAGRLIARHVMDCGARDILYAIPQDPFRGSGAAKVRQLRELMQRRGLSLPAERVLQTSPEPGLTSQQIQAYLREHPAPDCIVCSTDFVAAGTIDALHRLGLMVPDDIMVAGYSDYPIARATTPKLTTVRVPRFEMGKRAVQLLVDRIATPSEKAVNAIMPAELIIRESTCQPPAS